MKLNNRGFSLIELMVVVAIIAILSTIAIPSYQTFQAKARQKEGFALMSAYYSAAHASSAEYGGFPGNFVLTGFSPSGTLGYQLVAADTGVQPPYAGAIQDDAACVDTDNATACNCGGNCANFKQWVEAADGVVGTSLGPITPATAGAATATTFTIAVAGVIDPRSARQDEATMNQLKTLTIITDGTK